MRPEPKRQYKITNYFTFNDDAQVKLTPNPATNQTELEYRFSNSASDPYFVVRDITGKEMLRQKVLLSENLQLIQTSNLQQGIYQVQLMDGKTLLKSISLAIIK